MQEGCVLFEVGTEVTYTETKVKLVLQQLWIFTSILLQNAGFSM